MQSTSNLVVLLKARAAAENLGKPELADGTLHVSNLALSGCGRLDPLGRLAADTAYHVGMSEGLGSALLGLVAEGRGNGLCDARVERRGPAGDQEVVVALIAGAGSTFTVSGPGPGEGRVGVERGRHDGRIGYVMLSNDAVLKDRAMSTLGRNVVKGKLLNRPSGD